MRLTMNIAKNLIPAEICRYTVLNSLWTFLPGFCSMVMKINEIAGVQSFVCIQSLGFKWLLSMKPCELYIAVTTGDGQSSEFRRGKCPVLHHLLISRTYRNYIHGRFDAHVQPYRKLWTLYCTGHSPLNRSKLFPPPPIINKLTTAWSQRASKGPQAPDIKIDTETHCTLCMTHCVLFEASIQQKKLFCRLLLNTRN